MKRFIFIRIFDRCQASAWSLLPNEAASSSYKLSCSECLRSHEQLRQSYLGCGKHRCTRPLSRWFLSQMHGITEYWRSAQYQEVEDRVR